MVPREYSNECIVTRVTPYQVTDEQSKGPHPGKGTLDIGRVVWTKQPLADAAGKVDAYVNGVGRVQLEVNDLKPY